MTEEPPAPAGGSAGHLDAATLAELDEGLLPVEDSARYDAHLETCPECQDARRRVRAVQVALRALPDEPMPAAVAARLDDSLRGVTATIIPAAPAGRSRWRSRPTAAALSAVAAAAALVVAVVLGTTLGSGSDGAPEQAGPAAGLPGASSAQAKAATFPVLARGVTYTPARAARQVAQLLPASAASTTAGDAQADKVPPALRDLATDRTELLHCVAQLAGNTTTQPIVVDFGHYTDKQTVGTGKPAAVIVLPGTTAGRDEAWIVGPACATAPDNNLYLFQTVPASG